VTYPYRPSPIPKCPSCAEGLLPSQKRDLRRWTTLDAPIPGAVLHYVEVNLDELLSTRRGVTRCGLPVVLEVRS
jgi:hypothetical protein